MISKAAWSATRVNSLSIESYMSYQSEQERKRQAEKMKVIDFSHYSSTAWYALNKKCASSKGSYEYDRAGDACDDVKGCIEAIASQGRGSASYETKKSALETLRKIGKSIVSSNGVIAMNVPNQPCVKCCDPQQLKNAKAWGSLRMKKELSFRRC